jgi:allantoicase
MEELSHSEVKPMTVRQPRYSKEEFARRGNEMYESQVRSQVEEGNHGKIVAIDIETGAFEVADAPMVAVDQLYEREPDAQPWVIRIGHRAVFRFGSRSLRKPV